MILAIQTADQTAHLWLYKASNAARPVAKTEWESGRALADELPGRIDQFLAAYLPAGEVLTGIAIFSGPGSFTSLRIGHTVANALADSLRVPVAGAEGDQWVEAATQRLADLPVGQPALPHYGSDAHIIKPKT